MKELNEAEIAKAYIGKPYNIDHLRKVAMGTQSGAVVFSRRITRSQGALIGITDEIYERWWDADAYVKICIELDEETQTIKECIFDKSTVIGEKNGLPQFGRLTPTEEDLRIFLNVMEYVTTDGDGQV